MGWGGVLFSLLKAGLSTGMLYNSRQWDVRRTLLCGYWEKFASWKNRSTTRNAIYLPLVITEWRCYIKGVIVAFFDLLMHMPEIKPADWEKRIPHNFDRELNNYWHNFYHRISSNINIKSLYFENHLYSCILLFVAKES